MACRPDPAVCFSCSAACLQLDAWWQIWYVSASSMPGSHCSITVRHGCSPCCSWLLPPLCSSCDAVIYTHPIEPSTKHAHCQREDLALVITECLETLGRWKAWRGPVPKRVTRRNQQRNADDWQRPAAFSSSQQVQGCSPTVDYCRYSPRWALRFS